MSKTCIKKIHNVKKILLFPLFAFLAVLLSTCITAAEKAGQIIDGSFFEEKTLRRWQGSFRMEAIGGAMGKIEILEKQGREGKPFFVLSLEDFPWMEIRCSAPLEDGSFYPVRFHYLGGNNSGWNEYELELSGAAHFTSSPPSFRFLSPPEAVQISGGRIRLRDSTFTGAEALTRLRNRRERIIALAEWMRGYCQNRMFRTGEYFSAYWQPILLPETVPKKKRPAEWKKEGAEWIRGEGIDWNKTYTAFLLQTAENSRNSELEALRNSGALLRDWEEAVQWIYTEYAWEKIGEDLSREEISLKQIIKR
ncbi:MAG: hypothetical protein LBI90_10035 [Treponema sp.]|jgi:hypothetical protein|nr:hypothetical protein [Treponema sp.]